MLKGIPDIISPELMKILMEMGHGDDLVIGDGNFPAVSNTKRVVYCSGHCVTPILDAILSFFPLDTFVKCPVTLMKVVENEGLIPPIWSEYRECVLKHFSAFKEFEFVERFEFYERTKQAYAVVATSERALYGCIILKKGVIES